MQMLRLNRIPLGCFSSSNEVELFVQSRANLVLELHQQFQKANPDKSAIEYIHSVCQILLYECMYHWGTLPKCVPIEMQESTILPALKTLQRDTNFEPLSMFLQGVILKHLKRFDEAEAALLVARQPKTNHKRLKVVMAFAKVELAANIVQKEESVNMNANEGNQLLKLPQVVKYLEEAKKSKRGYDFERRIEVSSYCFLFPDDRCFANIQVVISKDI